MNRSIVLIILLLFLGINSWAGKLEKGFQAMDIYNYFDAKEFFEKSMKKDPVAASYGLSIIFLRTDNPFSNLDKAHSVILTSTENFSSLTDKKKDKYANLKIDSAAIFYQRNKISDALFVRSKLNHTVINYQNFIDTNPWSEHVDSAVYYRDRLAYKLAEEKNQSKWFKEFLETYPDSYLVNDAQSAFDRLNYREQTINNNFIDYVSFVKNFPNSPYRADAEDQIYQIYTKTGSLESYKNFIENYPENRNAASAWKKMFDTQLQLDYSTNSIQAFLKEFPNYPFKEDLLEQLSLVDRVLFPIKKRNKWGYIDESGKYYIRPNYESAEPFYEGLAIILLDGKYGFINKSGELIIDAIYDDAFRINEGHAVVSIDDKWGMVNRGGEFVIQPVYEDLGNLTEGLTYFSQDDFYGYFDTKGIIRLKPKYTAAEDFSNGLAIVSSQNNYGLIDKFGTTTIPFLYEKLIRYNDSIYAAQFDGMWGLLNAKGDTIIDFKFDYIGRFNDGRALVELDDEFNYVKPNGALILDIWIETYPECRQLAVFENGFAKIEYEDGYNLIDVNGKKLFAANRDDISFFSDYIAVKKGEKWGYLNKGGNLLIANSFTSASSFEGNYAKAGGAPLVGIINKRGDYKIEPYFERIDFFNDTVVIVKSRGHFGLLLTNGDTLLAINYIKVEPYTSEVVRLETKEEIFYYSLRGNRFIRKED